MDRLVAWWDTLVGAARRALGRLVALARDPLRVLPVLAAVALLAVSVPLLLTGLMRVGRSTMDWRADSAIHWRRAAATVTRVRVDDGLVVAVVYRDASGARHRASAFVGDAGGRWIDHDVRIRYDTRDPARVEIVGIKQRDPVLGLLEAGAPLGAGVAGLVLAVAVWRRRRLLAVSAHPLRVLRRSLILAAVILLAGIVAWAVGTVLDQGWSKVASAFGHLVSTVFGDLLGVLVPVVAFALGALLTAWLARHRHHEEHDDLLSSAHRFIDRAAGMVPSPEDLRARRDAPVAAPTDADRADDDRTVTPT